MSRSSPMPSPPRWTRHPPRPELGQNAHLEKVDSVREKAARSHAQLMQGEESAGLGFFPLSTCVKMTKE